MLITITMIPRAKSEQEREEFLNSLNYSHSGTVPFEFYGQGDPLPESDIHIDLPDDCLVLGNAWDKYIQFALGNGLPTHGEGKNFVPTWEGYIVRRMGLQTRRPPEGIFPDVKVTLATK